MSRSLGICLLLFTVTETIAQSAGALNEQDSVAIELAQLVVSGDRLSVGGRLVQEKLEARSGSISEALDEIPGFQKVQSNNFPLSFRGQHGDRLRVEQNGFRRTGVLQQGYYGEDLNPGDVGRINVVRGVEKAIFGSGSTGGIIQLIARTNITSQVYAGYESGNRSFTTGLGLTKSWEKLGISMTARRVDAADYRIPGGSKQEHSAFDQNTANLRISYDWRSRHSLVINQQVNNGLWQRPQGFQNNPFELRAFRSRFGSLTQLTYESRYSDELSLKHQLTFQRQETEQQRDSFDGTFDMLNRALVRSYAKRAGSHRSTLVWRKRAIVFRTGLDYFGSNIKEYLTEEDFVNAIYVNDLLDAERREHQGGVFAWADWLQGNWSFRSSFRADAANIGDGEVRRNFRSITGGLELEYAGASGYEQTLSVGRYFRYPSQLEATGVFFGGRGTFYGNPDITPEYNYQVEWQLQKSSGVFNYELEAWWSLFTNRIVEVPLGNSEFTYDNVSYARVVGLSAAMSYRFPLLRDHQSLQAFLGSTAMRGDELEGLEVFTAGGPLFGIPPMRLDMKLVYDHRFNTAFVLKNFIAVDQVFAFDRIPEGFVNQIWGIVETPAYTLLSLGTSAEAEIAHLPITLRLEATNLTNETYMPFGSRITEMGRSFRFFLTVGF